MLVFAIMKDGMYCKLFREEEGFDVQAWTGRKRQYLQFLGIQRLEILPI